MTKLSELFLYTQGFTLSHDESLLASALSKI